MAARAESEDSSDLRNSQEIILKFVSGGALRCGISATTLTQQLACDRRPCRELAVRKGVTLSDPAAIHRSWLRALAPDANLTGLRLYRYG